MWNLINNTSGGLPGLDVENCVLADPPRLGAAPHGDQVAASLRPVGGERVGLGAPLAQLRVREGGHEAEQRRVGRDVVKPKLEMQESIQFIKHVIPFHLRKLIHDFINNYSKVEMFLVEMTLVTMKLATVTPALI